MAATRSDDGPGDGPVEPDELVLAGEFDTPTRDAWLDAVDVIVQRSGRIREDALLGAGAKKLSRTSPDGITVAPLYSAEDTDGLPEAGVPGAWPFTRGAHAAGHVADGWDVRQRHTGVDPEAVLADLEGGVTSIWLAGASADDLPRALDGVRFDLAPVVLDGGADVAEAFLALASDHGTALLGTLGLDPIGERARSGDGPDVGSVVPIARRVAGSHPLVRAVVVDATPVREAGGSDAQQLGFSLSAGVAYLRALTDAGLDVAAAARLLEFRYAATPEQFGTIATLRAARRLWARVLEASGVTDVPQIQHAVVAEALFTRRDPWVNMLRGTVSGFAAGVGGADAVTVPPFDAALGRPQAFSRRIARNTQRLLVEESHLARVIDPAGGSWYVEHLTDDLARAAWEFFQELEREGGAVTALDSGLVARTVGEVRAGRERSVATRKAPLTGVSEFPDLDEDAVEREPLPGVGGSDDTARGGLEPYRPSEAYEAFRDRSDRMLAETGSRPSAFLATLGPLATYTARAGFTRNLLNAGGIAATEAGPTESADEVVEAFRKEGAQVAVLCSSDTTYDERAAETAAALREAGARRILLAGRPPEDVPGVDGYLYAGCDALAVIDDVYRAVESALEGDK